jgi:hypothetical protein
MSLSKNIIYDSDKISSDSDFYTKQLEIVSLNLDDFNKRFNSDILLRYNHNWNTFLLESPNERYGDVFVRHISYCLAFHNDENWSEEVFINRDLINIKSVMFNLYYHIKDDVDYFKQNEDLISELNLFLKRFDNSYSPLGILSNKGSVYYKNELNIIVSKLKSVLHLLD